ncbi:hypothetical protein D3C73_601350 [compost metagenome]
MNAKCVDIVGRQPRVIEQFVQMCGNLEQRKIEHLTTVHEEHPVSNLQVRRTGTVGTELGLAQLPGRLFAHPCSGSRITEEHCGVAIFRINDLGIRIGGHQQAILQARGFHEALDRINPVDVTGTPQGYIERGDTGRQAEFVLNDGCGVWQAFFVAVLGDDDQHVDGFTLQFGITGEQRIDCFDTQVRSFLPVVFARQEGRTDFAQDERFILLEFCTLCVIVHAGYRNVARNAFYANHYGFPIINSPILPLVMIRGAPTNKERRRPEAATAAGIKGYHWAKQRPGAILPIHRIQ